jgi:hypothetical protein
MEKEQNTGAKTMNEVESEITLKGIIDATEEIIEGDSEEAWYDPESPFTKDEISAIESYLKACGFRRVHPERNEYAPLTDGDLNTHFVMVNDNLGIIAGIVEYEKCKSPSYKAIKA